MLGYWLYLSPSEFVVLAGRNATVSTPASAKRFIAANSGMNERYENIFSPPNEADAATAARTAVKNVFTEFPMFCFLFVEKKYWQKNKQMQRKKLTTLQKQPPSAPIAQSCAAAKIAAGETRRSPRIFHRQRKRNQRARERSICGGRKTESAG